MDQVFFRDYAPDVRRSYITLATGEYYPDVLQEACDLYAPVLETFRKLLATSSSSAILFRKICEQKATWMRVQLDRVFKRYVSPQTPVELLKKKTQVEKIIREFGDDFREIPVVQAKFDSRPLPDEALCALLWEYKDRGQKGYDLTEQFFDLFHSRFAEYSDLEIWGPRRAGQDVQARSFWPDYPNDKRPLDFVISDKSRKTIYAVGLGRYDGDRGGAQEDDRTGGYRSCAVEVLEYAKQRGLGTKVIFINDGPGLLLGSMWEDYSRLEEIDSDRVAVMTLRMVPDRLTAEWLMGEETN